MIEHVFVNGNPCAGRRAARVTPGPYAEGVAARRLRVRSSRGPARGDTGWSAGRLGDVEGDDLDRAVGGQRRVDGEIRDEEAGGDEHPDSGQ